MRSKPAKEDNKANTDEELAGVGKQCRWQKRPEVGDVQVAQHGAETAK
jgi:hypothetical protein